MNIEFRIDFVLSARRPNIGANINPDKENEAYFGSKLNLKSCWTLDGARGSEFESNPKQYPKYDDALIEDT